MDGAEEEKGRGGENSHFALCLLAPTHTHTLYKKSLCLVLLFALALALALNVHDDEDVGAALLLHDLHVAVRDGLDLRALRVLAAVKGRPVRAT